MLNVEPVEGVEDGPVVDIATELPEDDPVVVDSADVEADTELPDVPSQVSPLPPLLDQVLSIQGMNSGQKQLDINTGPIRYQGLINQFLDLLETSA